MTDCSRANPRRSYAAALPVVAGMVLSLAGAMATAAEAPSAPDPAAVALEQLRAANRARADHAEAEAAWTLERQRLQALLAATRAETARLEHDAAGAEAARDAARTRLAGLGAGSDLEALRARLAEAGERLRASLLAVAAATPPGVVPALGGTTDFEAGVAALEAAERAAGLIAVEVVSGRRDGRPEAVKMLRAAGAAAWWVSLDGTAAGTVGMDGSGMMLTATTDEAGRAAIMAALAQAEGRAQPAVALLPAPAAGGRP